MKLTKTLLTSALLATSIFSFQSTAWADATSQLQQALKAAEKKDYETAFKPIQPLAKQGDADSQYLLGLLYATGKGVKSNISTANKWFRKACDNGYQEACKYLQ